jgi:hypothetical protein
MTHLDLNHYQYEKAIELIMNNKLFEVVPKGIFYIYFLLKVYALSKDGF